MAAMQYVLWACVLVPLLAVAAPPATTRSAAELLGTYPLDSARLEAPFWRSKTVWGESVLFVGANETTPAEATLLLKPARVRAVRNGQSGMTFEENRDYRIDATHRRLILTAGSRIARLSEADLYKKPNEPSSLGAKVDDPAAWLLWKEYGFGDKQVEVDYDTDEPWMGFAPRSAVASLPRTMGTLRSQRALRIVVSGDSISAGYNASGEHHDAPLQPAYPALLGAALQSKYAAKVTLLNLAVAGYRSEAAMKDLGRVIDADPDLVIVAYGMNDVGRKDPAGYARNIEQFIAAVRAKRPEAEFILVATSLGNPQWSAIPAEQFPRYRDALATLCAPERHIVLADMTTLWMGLLARKRYYDLTGNGLNHPNDFGHRLYAEVLLDLLVDGKGG